MAHLQYMPGDPRLVDQLVYELKSKGIFDQFRKDCIADVDTRPAYQNLRQRVENSVSSFLSRQSWKPDLNKNQLREKLRKHILDGNYLEQGVERIVDQVVNPKVASVFIPKVEDLVYNYLGITRKKSVSAETSNGKIEDLLPTDLEAVSPGSVKSNDNDDMETDNVQDHNKMEVDEEKHNTNEEKIQENIEKIQEEKTEDIQLPNSESNSNDKCDIPLPAQEIKPEEIPSPDHSPPKLVELEKIELPKDIIVSTDIPLPDDIVKEDKDKYFKPINSDDDESSSDSSLRRNMSPLTPIRNFNNENSSDAQQAFDDKSVKEEDKKELNTFRFAIEAKSPENSSDKAKVENKDIKDTDVNLSYQFNNQVNINNFNTPLYEDSSNSNNLQIDYESDANSKANIENKVAEIDQNSDDSKKERKSDGKRNSHKSSHRSRDSHRHSSSKDKKSDSKHSSSKESKHDKSKTSKEESKSKSSDKEKSKDRSDKKDSRDSSKHRSSHKSSHKDSKSNRSSSSSYKHSSKHSDDKKSSSSSQKDKDKSDKNMDKPKESRSNSHRSDKDRKSSSSSSKSDKHKNKNDDKEKDKKNKKEIDDHYSLSGRNNPNRRSTDRDSNDGSSSSKGSNHPSSSKSSQSKKESKSSSKSESTSTSGDSTSPSDKENIVHDHSKKLSEIQNKPIIRVESHLELPVASPPRLPFVPDVTIRKPKFAANLEEAKRLMKMRKFLDEEQKRMNQEAALLLEFQANVRPSLSQVYSSIPGPELEFVCMSSADKKQEVVVQSNDNTLDYTQEPHYTNNQLLNVLNDATIEVEKNNLQVNQKIIDAESNNVSSNIEEITEITELEGHQSDEDKIMETELSEMNDLKQNKKELNVEITKNTANEIIISLEENDKEETNQEDEPEVTIPKEEISANNEINKTVNSPDDVKQETETNLEEYINGEIKLHYFAEHEKYNAEIERATFSKFFKEYSKGTNKIYIINCDTYEENLIREESKKLGDFEIICYQKNGHLKLPKTKNVIKNVNVATEISLPYSDYDDNENVFCLDKSGGSSELDYDAKLEEMVNKTSRQEIMEIILGASASPSKMPRIDYFTDSKIDNGYDCNLKRKIDESVVNNNRPVLTPNKIRKMSTEQITSTTQENEERANNTRSKYLGKCRRVGLPRPKRALLPNSPSSDKSVENYEQSPTPNGRMKRAKVQRYDTSDLYKPKLHFLSRRNHIT